MIKKVIEIDVDELQALGGLNNLNKAVQETDKQTASLKTQIREATIELVKAQEEFGDYSDAALNAAKKVATLKDKVQEASETSKLFDPGAKFQAATGAIAAGANAVQGYQAALGLLGVEGEAVQETLLKVQSAMALSQSLSGIADSAKDFQRLGAVAKQALSGIRAGIAATGIGLLVVALGAIVAYWDDIKGAVNGVSSEQKQLNELANENLLAEQGKLETLGSQDNILKLQGKSEKDILKIKIAQTDQVIKATENQIAQNDITAKAQIEAAQRNRDILAGIIKFIQMPLTLVLEGVDMVGKALGKNFGLAQGFSDLVTKGASLVFDPEAEKAAAEKTKQESLKQLNKLKNDRAGFQLTIKNIDDQAAKDSIAKTKEAYDKRKEILDKELEDAKKRRKEETDIIEKAGEFVKQNDANQLDALKKIGENKNNELKTQYSNELVATKAAKDEELRIEQATADGKKAIQEASFAVVEGGISLLKGVFEKNKAIQKGLIIAESAMGIARIITSTQAANAADRAAAALMGPAGAGYLATKLVINKVGAGIGIAANIASTAKALSALGGGGGASAPSGGGGAPSGGGATAPSFNVVGNSGVNQIQQTLGMQQQQPIQAYVVANNVTTAQSLDRNIIRNASLG